ncbi:Protein tyrosine kinase [compost metagenome]
MVDNEFHIKLIDPGLCRQLSPEPTLSNIHYMAPEVLNCKTQSEQTEIYAFSMLMFELLFQTKALHVEENASLFTIGLEVVAGKRPQFPWIDDQGMEEWCNRRKMNQEQATQYINLMTKCWSADASQRPSFKEIQSILNDLYYTS